MELNLMLRTSMLFSSKSGSSLLCVILFEMNCYSKEAENSEVIKCNSFSDKSEPCLKILSFYIVNKTPSLLKISSCGSHINSSCKKGGSLRGSD